MLRRDQISLSFELQNNLLIEIILVPINNIKSGGRFTGPLIIISINSCSFVPGILFQVQKQNVKLAPCWLSWSALYPENPSSNSAVA